MGNYKFRFSDMMPNAWFYKLKDMGSSRRTRNQKNTTSTTTYAMKKKQPSSSPTTTAAHPQKQKQPHHHHLSQSRKSYYFTRDPITSFDTFYNSLTNTNYPTPEDTAHFPDPPRKSSKQGPKKKTRKSAASPKKLVISTVSAGCNCRASFESVWTRSDFSLEFSVSPSDSSPDKELLIGQSLVPEPRSDEALTTQSFDGMVAWSSSCRCKSNSHAKDIVIDMENKPETRKLDKINGFDSIPEIDLPPIITKPAKFSQMVNDFSIKETKKPGIHRKSSAKTEERKTATALKEQSHSPVKRFSGKSPGVRLRVKSPRIANMTQGRRSVSSSSSSSSRRSISDSFAVMKTSFNPQKDFKESMLEMIVENNIRASKDLEELLACYLSLNSDEYHDLIIKVFKQIWFDLTDIQRK